MDLSERSILGAYQGFSRQVWVLTAAAMIIFGGQILSRSAALYLSIATDISVVEIGAIVSIASIGGIIGAILAPIVTDRIGSSKTCLLAQGIASIIPFSILFMKSPILIGVALSIIGFCRAVFRPAYNAAVLDAAGDANRARAYSLYITVANVGAGFSALLAGALLSLNSVYVPIAESFLGIIGAIVVAIAFRGQPHHEGTQPAAERSLDEMRFTSLPICVCIVYLLSDIIAYQTHVTVPIFLLESYHLSPFQISMLNIIMTWPIAILSLPVTYYMRKFDQFYVASIAMLLLGLSFIIFVFGSGIVIAIASRLIFLAGSILLYPSLVFLLLLNSPEGGKSQYLSRYYLMSTIAGLIAPIGGGMIMSRSSPEVLWTCCFAVSLLSIFVILGASSKIEDRSAARPDNAEAAAG